MHANSTAMQTICIGKTANGGIATVRFTIRSGQIRIIGAGYWRKGKKLYDNNIKYTNAPDDIEAALDGAVVIADMLPLPAELIRKSAKEKITIAIDKDSLELFKKYAKRHDAKYQTMINDVVGAYADRFLRR